MPDGKYTLSTIIGVIRSGIFDQQFSCAVRHHQATACVSGILQADKVRQHESLPAAVAIIVDGPTVRQVAGMWFNRHRQELVRGPGCAEPDASIHPLTEDRGCSKIDGDFQFAGTSIAQRKICGRDCYRYAHREIQRRCGPVTASHVIRDLARKAAVVTTGSIDKSGQVEISGISACRRVCRDKIIHGDLEAEASIDSLAQLRTPGALFKRCGGVAVIVIHCQVRGGSGFDRRDHLAHRPVRVN